MLLIRIAVLSLKSAALFYIKIFITCLHLLRFLKLSATSIIIENWMYKHKHKYPFYFQRIFVLKLNEKVQCTRILQIYLPNHRKKRTGSIFHFFNWAELSNEQDTLFFDHSTFCVHRQQKIDAGSKENEIIADWQLEYSSFHSMLDEFDLVEIIKFPPCATTYLLR